MQWYTKTHMVSPSGATSSARSTDVTKQPYQTMRRCFQEGKAAGPLEVCVRPGTSLEKLEKRLLGSES